jgi:hypothetical protein
MEPKEYNTTVNVHTEALEGKYGIPIDIWKKAEASVKSMPINSL